MFEDNNMSKKMYYAYYNLIRLYKEDNAMSVKLDELINILKFLIDNYDNFNSDEIKLFKNILIISNAIINNVKNSRKKTQEKIKICLSLIEELESKKKEPKQIK